jgi:hypothetical protein
VIQKMAKQRRDSIDSYLAGGRPDLVEKEQQWVAAGPGRAGLHGLRARPGCRCLPLGAACSQ